MHVISEEKFNNLLSVQDETCFSLFMPLESGVDDAEKNRIRLKNLAKSAEAKFAEAPRLTADKGQLLAPLEGLMENGRLLHTNDHQGAAWFFADDDTQFHLLPHRVPEQIIVDQQFFVKPLLPALNAAKAIFLLTLSQNEVRLYHAQPDEIEHVSLDNLPQNIAEALAYDDPEKRQQYHTSTSSPQAPGDQPAAFHTHNPADEKKSRLRRFCYQVDEAVSAYLSVFDEGDTPLLLAGVDYLLAIYREVNAYPHLLDEEIQGNVEHMSAEALQEQVLARVKDKALQERERALDRYNQSKGNDLASSDFAEIVAAAHYGRIDTLFVAQDSEQWGRFDVQTSQVTLTEAAADSRELTNFATRHTLLNSGTTYLLPGELMPDNSKLAAVFRYDPNS